MRDKTLRNQDAYLMPPGQGFGGDDSRRLVSGVFRSHPNSYPMCSKKSPRFWKEMFHLKPPTCNTNCMLALEILFVVSACFLNQGRIWDHRLPSQTKVRTAWTIRTRMDGYVVDITMVILLVPSGSGCSRTPSKWAFYGLEMGVIPTHLPTGR